jgi:hypothetical protein
MGTTGALDRSVRNVFRPRSNLVIICMALFAPFIVGYQVLEWSWPYSSHVGFAMYSATWMLVVTGSLDRPLNEFNFYIGGAIFPVTLLPILLGFAYAAAVGLCDGTKRSLVIAVTLCILNILLGLYIAVMATMSPHMINPPGINLMIRRPTSDFTVYTPTPVLVLSGLYLLRRRHQKDAGPD